MALRQEIEKAIKQTKADIHQIELRLQELRGALQAYESTLSKVERQDRVGIQSERALRSGSSVAKAREAIKKAGVPLRIEDILKAIGKPADKKNRVSLSGSLAHYVRNGQIFTRPEPNTFGLVEFEGADNDESEESEAEGGSEVSPPKVRMLNLRG